MDDPRTLIESDEGDALARLVRGARAMEVEYDLPSAVARHEALVAAGVPPLVPQSGGGLRWVWIGCAIAVIGGAALVVTRSPERSGDPIAHAEPSVRDVDAAEPMRVPAPIVATRERVTPSSDRLVPATTSEPAPAKTKGRAAPRTRADAPPSAAVESDDDDDRIAREAAQVRRIRELLDGGDAKAALSACEAGDREFARGVFALERDGLRTLAALALDRPDARADAEAYLERHPRAPLAGRIRDALAK